jgi:hypothetical protein
LGGLAGAAAAAGDCGSFTGGAFFTAILTALRGGDFDARPTFRRFTRFPTLDISSSCENALNL